MNRRAFRRPNQSALVFGLLLTSLAGAAVAGESPRLVPRARAAFQASTPPQTMACQSCVLAHQQCFATCFAGTEKEQTGACLTACNNAAVTCTCNGAATLRSEDLVQLGLVSITKSATCNPVVSCQPDYPSCANWSGYSGCGEPWCDLEPDCEDCSRCEGYEDDWPICLCDPGPAHHEIFERFRVCFNQFGHSCVEWQRTIGYMCGC